MPKNFSHKRFTATRAVSGFSGATSHARGRAGSSARPRAAAAATRARRASTLSPCLSYSPRLSMKASRGCGSSSITIVRRQRLLGISSSFFCAVGDFARRARSPGCRCSRGRTSPAPRAAAAVRFAASVASAARIDSGVSRRRASPTAGGSDVARAGSGRCCDWRIATRASAARSSVASGGTVTGVAGDEHRLARHPLRRRRCHRSPSPFRPSRACPCFSVVLDDAISPRSPSARSRLRPA